MLTQFQLDWPGKACHLAVCLSKRRKARGNIIHLIQAPANLDKKPWSIVLLSALSDLLCIATTQLRAVYNVDFDEDINNMVYKYL